MIGDLTTIGPSALRAERGERRRHEGPVATRGSTSPAETTATGLETGTVERRGIARVRLRVELPWDKVSEFYRGVIGPLKADGADIRLEVYLQASSLQGSIKQATLDHKVRETLKQLDAQVLEEDIG